LGAATITSWRIALAPEKEQREIAAILSEYMAYIDSIELTAKDLIQTNTRLDQAILAKAFRGELAPQDPNDETLEGLLQRLATVTQNRPEKPRTQGAKMKGRNDSFDTETLRSIILDFKSARFTSTELFSAASTDYETFKETLFSLLQETPPVIRQAFDRNRESMMLERLSG
jgi:hypothetical protein